MKALKPKQKKALIMISVLIACAYILFVLIDAMIKPAVFTIAEADVREHVLRAMNAAILEVGEDSSFEDIMKIVQDESGKITVVQANTIKINRMSSLIGIKVQDGITAIGSDTISVELGTAIGGQLLSGMGPPISVTVVPAGSVWTSFDSSFEAYGINQTRHTVTLFIEATVSMIIGGSEREIMVSNAIPVYETVIVGEVPNIYFNSGDDKLRGSGGDALPNLDDSALPDVWKTE